MQKIASAVLFGVFLFVTLFGLPMLLSHDGHHVGCPLQGAAQVMCESTIVEHFSMWGSMFASMLATLFLVVGLSVFRIPVPVSPHTLVRYRRMVPHRPTVLQELYSSGILNRKEPHAFS